MTTKTKVRVSVAIASVAALMVIVAIVGLCLTFNRSYTFKKGKVSFVSSDINATITKANIRGGESSSNKMQQLDIDGMVRDCEGISTWSNLDFNIARDSKDIVISFRVINHSVNKTLKIDLGQIEANQSNAEISACFEGQESGSKVAYVKRAKTNQQGDVIEESFKQVIITLHVNNKRKDASITNFNLPISLQNIDSYVVNISDLSAEDDANTIVYSDMDTNQVKLDNKLEVCGQIVTLINNTNYKLKYSYSVNNGTINSVEIAANGQFSIGFESDSNVSIISIVKQF